jgi:hypothetical protein
MCIRKLRTDKILQELEHFFTSGWHAGDVRGFVESIYDDVRRRLSLYFEHVRQTLGECVVRRLLCSFIVIQIETRENMMAGIGPGAELEEEGGKEITSVLLLGVPEVEEEVGHQS